MRRVFELQVQTTSQPHKPAHGSRVEADSGMRRRDPDLGLTELWSRLKRRDYTRRPESLYRVMRKLDLLSQKGSKKAYIPKPYGQMIYLGERVRVDVKVVPHFYITAPDLRLFQYTAIDKFSRLRFLTAYEEQSMHSSADFLKRLPKWYACRRIRVEYVQIDNGFEFTNRFSNSKRNHTLGKQLLILAFVTIASSNTLSDPTEKDEHSHKIVPCANMFDNPTERSQSCGMHRRDVQ